MNAKIKIDRLVSVIEKGMISISISEKDTASFSDFGRLTIDSKGISVKACSSQSSSICSLPINSGEEITDSLNFSLSLPRLLGMLSSLPKDSIVSIEFEDVKTDDYIGNMVFSSGKSLWKMPCLHSNLIPDVNIEEGEECFSIDKEVFLEAISLVAFSSNINDANFTTNNLCVSIREGKLYLGATDDIRCACYVIDYPAGTVPKRFLVPIQSVNKIVKSFDKGNITVFSGNRFVRLSQDSYSIKLSLPNESDIKNFPAFEQLIQKDFPFKLKVMTSRLKSMIVACHEMNRDEFLLKIDNDSINVYAVDKVCGMTYKSAIPYTGDKIDVSIGVCTMFLVEYLKKNKEEILQIEFNMNQGKPKFVKIQNGIGSHYIMKALIDLVNVPESPKVDA